MQTESQTPPAEPPVQPAEAAPTAAAEDVVTEPASAPRISETRARFSEILPDPAGADELNEFIEIENLNDAEADHAGWKIEGNGGKTYVIGVHLGSKAKYAFSYAETKIALVNSGMTLTLRDPAGSVADTLTYVGPAKTGKSYARAADGAWQWTSTPTPGSENAFDPPAPEPAAATTAVAQNTVTEPATTVPSVSPAPPPTDEVARNVSIVEIMPDPIGDDAAEWITLANDGTAEATLDGWKLDDAAGGSAPYPLTGIRIPAGGRTRITRATSKLALNNDGDAVRLLGPDDAPRQAVTYANAPEGKTFSLIAGAWKWLPDESLVREVVGTAAPVDAAATSVAGSPTTTADAPADADETPADATVTDISPDDDSLMDVEGVVTLAPGVVGKRTFAMQDPSGLGGVFVRAYGSLPLPRLVPGDRIRVVGRASSGAAGFSTTGAHVRKTGRSVVTAEERGIDEIGIDEDGTIVRVTGTVSHRNRTVLTLTDGSAGKEIRVRIPARSTFPLSAVAGATVAAKGVARAKPGGIELILSGTDAVAVLPATGPKRLSDEPTASRKNAETTTVPEPKKPLVFAYMAKKTAPGIAVGGGIAVLILATAVTFAIMRRRKAEELDRLAVDR